MPGERFVVGSADSLPDDDPNDIFGSSCVDITGRRISGGQNYVPGPDSCTVCMCDRDKGPTFCQAVLCAAPKGCKSFRIGNSCCEFICLDDKTDSDENINVTWNEDWMSGDLGLRLIATAVTAILSLALLVFLFYRLKKRRMQQLEESGAALRTSLSSLNGVHGDLTSSMAHLSRQPPTTVSEGENQSPVYLVWKMPTVSPEAPPPYTEAPAQQSEEQRAEDSEPGQQETIGLLAFTASAPVHDLEDQEQVRSSTDTLNSDLLGRGTPPPSYSEVLAAISTHHLDETATEDFAISLVPVQEPRTIGRREISSDPYEQLEENQQRPLLRHGHQEQQSNRSSLSLPRVRARDADVAIQRFSLQLTLDWSESSSNSSSSTFSQAPPLSISSSSSDSIAYLVAPITSL